MIVDERTTTYEAPVPALTEREAELHIHYASNALVRGHAANCRKVTDARNWPTLWPDSPCTCGHGGR